MIVNSLIRGLVLGLLTLTRSIAWLLWIPSFVSLIFQKQSTCKVITSLTICIAAQMVVLSPWAFRNAMVLGEATFLTTTSGINLFIGNNPDANGEWYDWIEDMKEFDRNFDTKSVVMQNKIAGTTAWNWIIQNPSKAARLYIHKWGRMFKNNRYILEASIFGKQISPPWPAVNVLHDESGFVPYKFWLELIFDGYYWITMIIGLFGLFISFETALTSRLILSQWFFIFLSILYFPTIAAIFLASTRFLWPSTDLLITFSAGALSFIISKKDLHNIVSS